MTHGSRSAQHRITLQRVDETSTIRCTVKTKVEMPCK
jgi:hypothetical protein